MSSRGSEQTVGARILLLVQLHAHPGRAAALADYEGRALAILGDHGGRLEVAIRPTAALAGEGELPDEVHVVSFPSLTQLQAYRKDPRLVALASERDAAIAKTTLLVGHRVRDR